MRLTITTLIENKVLDNDLQSEHGLSFYIQAENDYILFDTGQSGNFIDNAYKLGINLKDTTHVVISHGHYDHSGGFKSFINRVSNKANLYIGRYFFNQKYALVNGKYNYNGAGFDRTFIKDNNITTNYIEENIMYIAKDIFIATNFPRKHTFESINDKFHIKTNGKYIKDDFRDEIVLGLNTPEGLVVIIGCSHPGIINILETIMTRTGKNIYMVIGGTHLVNADDDRINKTIEYMKKLNIKHVGLSHCTGDKATIEISENINSYFENHTGTVIQIGKQNYVRN